MLLPFFRRQEFTPEIKAAVSNKITLLSEPSQASVSMASDSKEGDPLGVTCTFFGNQCGTKEIGESWA